MSSRLRPPTPEQPGAKLAGMRPRAKELPALRNGWNPAERSCTQIPAIPAVPRELTAAWREVLRAMPVPAEPMVIRKPRLPAATTKTPAEAEAVTAVPAVLAATHGIPISAWEAREARHFPRPSIASRWAAAVARAPATTLMATIRPAVVRPVAASLSFALTLLVAPRHSPRMEFPPTTGRPTTPVVVAEPAAPS